MDPVRYFFIKNGKNFYYENFIEFSDCEKILFFSSKKVKNFSKKIKYCLYKDIDNFLGTTVDMVIIDDLNYLNSNLLTIICGTVCSAGRILFNYKKDNLFVNRFIKILKKKKIGRCTEEKNENIFSDQQILIEKLTASLRRKSGKYFITSARGCGKTVSIPLLINNIHMNFNRIEILGRREIIFPFLNSNIENIHFLKKSDRFFGDLIFIDEASSLPINFLKTILMNRLVIFLSTNETYEGNFNFFTHKILQEFDFKIFTLQKKIRIENRILNSFNRAVLLFNSELQPINKCKLKYLNLNKNILFSGTAESEYLLEKIGSLFRLSHYKNSLNDLRNFAILDNHYLYGAFDRNNNLAGVVYYKIETDCRSENLINYRLGIEGRETVRIIRISVHPNYKNSGIGSELIEKLICSTEYDFYAVAFSLTPLYNFWCKNDFLPVFLSKTKNKLSGEFSIFMMRECSAILPYVEQFYNQFINDISYFYTEVDLNLIENILSKKVFLHSSGLNLNMMEKIQIEQFLKNQIDFIDVISLLHPIAKYYFKTGLLQFNDTEKKILILLGLQRKSLNETYRILRCTASDLSFYLKGLFNQINLL